MLITLPIIKENSDKFYNLDEFSINTIYNDYLDLTLSNHILEKSNLANIESTKYINKNICVEYIENISEPSKTVPNDIDFRFILKRNNEFLFKKTNPKKLEVYDSLVLNALIDTDYNSNNAIIAKELHTDDNNYKVYSFPYGGIDKYDSYFFYVNSQNKIKKLDSNIDYINGVLYVLPENNPDISFVFAYFNLIPLKIITKGDIKVEEQESNSYTIKNVDNNNFIDIQYLNSNSILLTTLKHILIEVPLNSLKYSIDGVVLVKGQTVFVEKNETIYIEKINEPEKNIEYLSSNTKLKNSLDDSNKKDFIYLDKNKDISVTEETYLLKIINKENTNTYMKQTPLILKLF